MKSFLVSLERLIWSMRCSYGLWLHGPYGLSKIVEKLPFRHCTHFLRKYGATIGQGGIIERGLYIHRPFGKNKPFENLHIGKNVYIGKEVILDLTMPLTLKDASSIGARVQIWTHSGYYKGNTLETRDYTEDREEVIIEEGAMVYSGSLVKHGTRIGKFASVAALSMVNRNVEDYATASGVPIRVIQRRETNTDDTSAR